MIRFLFFVQIRQQKKIYRHSIR